MMRIGRTLFLVAIASVLVGCATIPQPRTSNDTLVVGNVSVNVTNGASYGATGADGFHQAGIVVYLKNLPNGATIHATSSNSGLFYAAGLRPGRYALVRLFYEMESGNWGYSQSTNMSLPFTVAAGRVTNLGRIVWSTDEPAAHDHAAPADLGRVKSGFAAEFPESKWIESEWGGPSNDGNN